MPEISISFFDFDNTLYKGKSRYLILDFATFLEANDFFDSDEFSVLNSLFSSYHQGRINRHDFGVLAVQSYYRGLTGFPEEEIIQQARLFWDRIQDEAWFSYTLPLMNLINKKTKSILISGSPFEIIKVIIITLGFKELFASKGIIQNGFYTGKTQQEMATYSSKAELMQGLLETLNFEPATSFAFGDSESDIPLLEVVDPRNAYLLGVSAKLKLRIMNKNWNLPDQENEVINNVTSRINELFPS